MILLQHFVSQPDLITVTDLANHAELKTYLPTTIPAREGTRPSMKSRPYPQREVQSIDALRFREVRSPCDRDIDCADD